MSDLRPLPQSLPLEQSVLGTLLYSPDCFRMVVSVTQADHFCEPAHVVLFDALKAQFEAGRSGDIGALAAALRVKWQEPFLEGMTFGQYVATLVEYSTAPQFLTRQATDLRDLWAMRKILSAAERPALADGAPAREQLASLFDDIDQVRAALVEGTNNRCTAGESGQNTISDMLAMRSGEKSQSGVTTGFIDLDAKMLGYRPGELVVVAARPGMGKTTFGTSSLIQSATAGIGALLFSMELAEETIGARMLADLALDPRRPLTHSQIRAGKVSEEECDRVEKAGHILCDLPIQCDYTTRLTIAEIGVRVAVVRKKMEAAGIRLGVVVLDYLKFIKATDRYRGQRVYEVGEITAGLKEIAKEQGVCVVLMAQLNRGTEAQADKRPDLQHLRESGDIEGDADVVMFLYREAYYIEKSPEFRAGNIEANQRLHELRNTLEVIVAKNRNGPTCTVELFCDIGASAIRNAQRYDRRYGEAI